MALMAETTAGMGNVMRTLVHMHDRITQDGMVEDIDRQYGTI